MDANGKLVTRHVRDGIEQSVQRRAIPAPTVPAKRTITKALRPVYADIMTMCTSQAPKIQDWETVRNHLVPLSNDELSEVQDAMISMRDNFPSVNREFMKIAIKNGHALHAARVINAVCDGISTSGLTDPHKTLGGALLGAVEMKMLDDDWSFPEGRKEHVRARVLAVQAIIEACPTTLDGVRRSVLNTYTLNNYELGNLIEEKVDQSDDIVQAILSRQTSDAGLIRELLDHDVRSLTSGVL